MLLVKIICYITIITVHDLEERKMNKGKFKICELRYENLFLAAIFLLTYIFLNICLSSFLFIFNISITAISPVLAGVLSVLINLYLTNAINNSNIDKIKCMFFSVLLPLLIITFSIYINGKVIDYTWDGNSYQKAAIGLLAYGWNPLYEHIQDFDDRSDIKINIRDESPLYMNHYAKGSNIFGANIYKLTGNIETGKSINIISIIMIFLFTFSYLIYKKKSLLFSLMFSLSVMSYPVICAQFLTNYIDLLVYIFLYMNIFLFFILEENEFKFSKNVLLALMFMVLVISINIKFSLFAFAGIYSFAYYLWYIYRLIKKQIDKSFFIKFTISAVCSVVIGVFVIGTSTYLKNFIEHGNPFYPLMGEEKVDIMTANQPKVFDVIKPYKKFFISNFSESADIYGEDEVKPKLKIPFTFTKNEMFAISAPDTRIGGNGVLFGGILILSVIAIILLIQTLFEENRKIFTMFLIPTIVTILMILFLDESWWARYFPQVYLFVLLAVILLNDYNKIPYKNILTYVFMLIILTNNSLTFVQATKRSYKNNVLYNSQFQILENTEYKENETLEIYTDFFHGAKFNVLDKFDGEDTCVKFIKGYAKDKNIEKLFDGKIEWRFVK